MEDNDSNKSAINALLDISENWSEYSGKLSEKSRLLTDDKAKQIYSGVNSATRILSSISIRDVQKSNTQNKLEEKEPDCNNSDHHSSSSARITSLETDRSRENYDDNVNLSYTSDFSSNNSTQSKNEVNAWEKWFVTKQEEIRRRTEMEKKRRREKEKERQYQEMLKQKKREVSLKKWLERKKIEMQNRNERKEDKSEKINQGYHTYEDWVLRKNQQKKVEHLRRDYIKKREEEERKNKMKQSEEAVKRWMTRAKQKSITPKMSYAYCGGSTVSFYDSTRPPSPTFVNPLPWKDPGSPL